MGVLKIVLGDVVRMRKTHPCGNDQWEVVRLGADIGIRCLKCGRRVLMPRVKFERRIRQFIRRGEGAEDDASQGGSRGTTTPG
ncbi:MAG: DUF951 domain-containing protein [Armatimonadota bacterium]|nr:DUF951 domain-containing protein [Armatimonadota bacterium]